LLSSRASSSDEHGFDGSLQHVSGFVEDQYAKVDCSVREDVPVYKLSSDLLGSYSTSGVYCPGGHDECEHADLRDSDGGFELVFGEGAFWDGKVAKIKSGRRVLE